MSSDSRGRQLGAGTLARWAGVVYWFAVIEALIVLTALPTFLGVFFLERDVSNIPLYALALVPLGPSLGAALFAWRVFDTDKYPNPGTHFWRGYRVGLRDVVKTWVPLLLVLMILAMNIAHRQATGVPEWFAIGFALLALGLVLWGCNALPIAALLTFRWRDSARLALYYLAGRPGATLGWLALLVVVVGILWYSSDWVLVLLLSPLTFFAHLTARPMIAEITANHTSEDPPPTPPR